MKFEEYEIITIVKELSDVFFIRLKPKRRKYIPAFRPGQFYHMRNPRYTNPNETRQFSVITTPATKNHLEFCIRSYGPWTKALLKKKPGESIWLFGPMGQFTFRKTSSDLVFLAGGVGIAPILSILQSLDEKSIKNPTTLIYANKSTQHILKKLQIESLFRGKSAWKLIFLVSQTDGHIDSNLLKKEVNLEKTPIFYICGSQRFTQNMSLLLQSLAVAEKHIKQEIFLPPYPVKTKKDTQ